MSMSKLAASLAAIAAASIFAVGPVSAQNVGDTVNATLAFGPNGAFGGQYWAPDSITAPGSFNYADGANVDSAVFGDHTLTINDNVLWNANGWEMTFTDATPPFTGLSLVSSTFTPGLTYSFSGGTLKIDWEGTSDAAGPLAAVFAVSTGSVPEPASWALMLGGFGLVGGAMRSRRKAAVTFA